MAEPEVGCLGRGHRGGGGVIESAIGLLGRVADDALADHGQAFALEAGLYRHLLPWPPRGPMPAAAVVAAGQSFGHDPEVVE